MPSLAIDARFLRATVFSERGCYFANWLGHHLEKAWWKYY
jgi:hypothetical protein